jgi:glycosyltransferase involved in cell wall biosynthesis
MAAPASSRSIVFFGHHLPTLGYMQFLREVAEAFGHQGWRVVWVSPPGEPKNLRYWLSCVRDRVLATTRGGLRTQLRSPGDLMRCATRAFSRIVNGELLRNGSFWDFRPWGITLFPHPGFRPLDELALWQLRRALGRTGVERPHIVLFGPGPAWFARRIPRARVAYWFGDEAAQVMEGSPIFREVLDDVDVIFAISPPCFETASARYGDKVLRTSLGVSVDQYRRDAVVPEIAALGRPVVGYAGSIHAGRFDADLFVQVAGLLPEVAFVLVGPADPAFLVAMLDRASANVRYLGVLPYEQVPRYVTSFDVGVVPYLRNDFNLGADPLKVYEYFAAGLPVVSTRLPAVEERGDLVELADDAISFANAVSRAIVEGDPDRSARRRAVAEEHSPERVAERLTEGFGAMGGEDS